MSAARMNEVNTELAQLAASQEKAVMGLLAATINALDGVAGKNYAGRNSVRMEARRLKMVLEREAPSFARIVEQAS